MTEKKVGWKFDNTYSKLPKALEIIQKTANTGKIGDGKIFVYKVENAIRIRTNEKSDNLYWTSLQLL